MRNVGLTEEQVKQLIKEALEKHKEAALEEHKEALESHRNKVRIDRENTVAAAIGAVCMGILCALVIVGGLTLLL